MFNRLLYVDTLKSAGVPEDQARAHASALQTALLDTVATKDDIAILRTDINALRGDMEKLEISLRGDMEKLETSLRGDMEKLETSRRGDMGKLETSLRGDMGKLETSLRGEMRNIDTTLRAEIAKLDASLRGEMAAQKTDILRWMFGMMIGFSGLMITAIKFIR